MRENQGWPSGGTEDALQVEDYYTCQERSGFQSETEQSVLLFLLQIMFQIMVLLLPSFT